MTQQFPIGKSLPAQRVVSGAAGGGGAPGAAEVIVANEAAASALVGLTNGQKVFILSHRSIWVFNSNDTAALKAHEIIASASAGASPRLTRTAYSDPAWRNGITDLYIDPANATGIASDENTAIFNAPQVGNARAPLLTWAELSRRWGARNEITTGDAVGFTFQVHILSSVGAAANDGVALDFVIGLDTFPRILGENSAALLAGVLDAVGGFTAQNPAANAACQIKVGATNWTGLGLVGKRIRFTATGAVAIILKDLGAGSARVSQPVLTNEALFAASPTATNPPNGAAFVVEDPARINPNHWHISAKQPSSFGFAPQVNVADVRFAVPVAPVLWGPRVDEDVTVIRYQSMHDYVVLLKDPEIFNGCGFSQEIHAMNGNRAGIFGGGAVPGAADLFLMTGGFFVSGVLDFDFVLQGRGVMALGPVQFGSFAVFDCAASAVNGAGHAVRVGGAAVATGFLPPSACAFGSRVWGSGSVGKGMVGEAGSRAVYQGTLPTVTGALGDLKLADSAVGWWWDPVNAIYQPPGGIGLTWAAVAAATGVGGFGGSAHEPNQDAHLVKAALS